MSDILINEAIPRTMTRQGLEYLGRLARLVPKNGVIVEVGPLFGSSTWVLAKNADPSVKVISIDTWEPQPWIDKIERNYPGCKPFSKDAFDFYVRDCPNVQAVQGYSPGIMSGWNEPIDMFFDDATHGNPGFTESLDFFLPKLKAGGVACGDDFASGWPDIVRGVYDLATRWGGHPEIIGRVWALVKPLDGVGAGSVYDKAGPYSPYDISISVKRIGVSEEEDYRPGSWAGRLHGTEAIRAVKLDWAQPRTDKLSAMIQVRDAAAQPSPWYSLGEWVDTGGNPIASFRAHLVGEHPPELRLGYQGCAIIAGRKKSYTRNTRAFKDAEWMAPEEPFKSKAISALRCFVIDATETHDPA